MDGQAHQSDNATTSAEITELKTEMRPLADKCEADITDHILVMNQAERAALARCRDQGRAALISPYLTR
jgi:hypothetical protein